MPRVWITLDPDTALMTVSETETEGGVPVEMNASLYRQIKAANKKFWQFQVNLRRWHQGKANRRIS